MRRALLGIVAGTAMALGSTAANASISLITCDPSLSNCSVDNTLAPTQSTLAWDDSSVTSPTFTATIDFANTLAGNYWLSLTTSTPGLLFTALTVTPITGSGSITYVGGPTSSISLLPGYLGIGSYHLSFSGQSPELGRVTFEGRLDAGALATARRNLGGDGVVMTGRLRVGGQTFDGVRMTWWMGD